MEPKSLKPRPRRGGRPAAEESRDVRGQLLMAARDLFTRHGFDAVSTRQLATAADTTPAMIHYYFEDKHGLYRALLEEIIPPVLGDLEARTGELQQSLSVADFMAAYLGMFRANPWLPPLVFREMQAGGERFQRHFIERFASRARLLLGTALESDKRAGRVRVELDTQLALVSVMSLCVFPFLARPMLEKVLDVTFDHDFVARWSQYASELFYHGAQP
jgi:TetR/AcrR family transcriptional regulator